MLVNIDECFVNKGEKYVNIRENKRKKHYLCIALKTC